MKNHINSVLSKLSKSKKKISHGSPPASVHELISPKSVLPRRECFSPSARHDLFSLFNRPSDGKIKKAELEAVLRHLEPRIPPADDDISSLIDEIYLNREGCININELGAIFPKALSQPAVRDDELRDAFSVFDADGNGKISAEELRAVFVGIGYNGCTFNDCRRMIRAVDTDGDGFVCFGEFVRMMSGQI